MHSGLPVGIFSTDLKMLRIKLLSFSPLLKIPLITLSGKNVGKVCITFSKEIKNVLYRCCTSRARIGGKSFKTLVFIGIF